MSSLKENTAKTSISAKTSDAQTLKSQAEPARTWTREAIEQQLKLERFDYQRVPLPFGLATEGHDRSSTAAEIFGDDLAGKSVLDVGASLGFFCFEAEKRGATDVVGIDVHPESVRKARLLAEMKGSQAQFVVGNLESTYLDRKFDQVFCLNVLHHLHDPIAALNRLIDITKEKLILEVATFGAHDKRKVGLPAFICNWLSRFPIIFVTATGTRGKREVQRFYMSEKAIFNILKVHRGVFAKVELKPSGHKGRFVAIAHKRQIDHLLVVGGPTSSGKKTIMARFMSNQMPELAKALGTPDATVWGERLNANHLDKPDDQPVRSHVMLHYDIMRPFMRSTRVYERDEAMDLLSCAKRITFLTVATPSERLFKQITAAEIDKKFARSGKAKNRHLRIREMYQDPAKVKEIYSTWIDFTKQHSDTHWMIEMTSPTEFKLFPAEEYVPS